MELIFDWLKILGEVSMPMDPIRLVLLFSDEENIEQQMEQQRYWLRE